MPKRIHGAYGKAYLVEYDTIKGTLNELYSWYQFDSIYPNKFISPGFTGLHVTKKYIYIGSHMAVFIFDRKLKRVVNVLTHRLMSDVHGICFHNNKLYVTSTAIDTLLVFDKDFSLEATFPLSKQSIIHKLFFKFKDYRFISKKITGLHHYHLNDVYVYGENIYLTSKNDVKGRKGCFIKMDMNYKEIEYISRYELDGPHDGILVNNNYYLTEGNTGRLVKISKKDYNVERIDLNIDPEVYWVRGLTFCKNKFYLGLTTHIGSLGVAGPKALSSSAKIIVLNDNLDTIENEIILDGFYDKEAGCAIYALCTEVG